MIQRKQSLYLFIAVLLLALLFVLPFGSYQMSDGARIIMNFKGIVKGDMMVDSNPLILISAGLTMLVLLITIFLFKNRSLQMKWCFIGIILLIHLLGSILLLWFRFQSMLKVEVANMQLPVIFPLIGVVLVFMARMAIKKDDDLVRSADRIR